MLEVKDLSVTGPDGPLVHPVSFSVSAGQSLVIMGETGAGKSLIVQAIMGAMPAALTPAGEVFIDGTDASRLSAAARQALWGRQIALLPQEPWRALDPLMLARAQVSETYRFVAGRTWKDANRSAAADFDRLGLLGAERKRPGELSGGMGQRVAFAAASAGGADILLADEPTKGLDPARAQTIVRLLRETPEKGGALIVITHEVAVARAIGGMMMVMKDGHTVEVGLTETVLTEPQHAYTKAIIAADPSNWPQPPSPLAGAPVLSAQNLSIGRKNAPLLDGFDLTITAGERLAITGPSGTGKTTLLDTLAGVLPPLGGAMQRAPEVGPTGIQKIYQDPPAAFAPQVSLRTSLRDVANLHNIAWADIERLLTGLQIEENLLARRPDAVSGGELQRIAIARALAVRPQVLLADEPTSRLDPITQMETMRLLATVCAQTNTAVILVTHDTALAAQWASRTITLSPITNTQAAGHAELELT